MSPKAEQAPSEASLAAQNEEIRRFTTREILLTIGWTVLAELVIRLGMGVGTPLAVYAVILYSGVMTILIHRLLAKANESRPTQFVNLIMGLIGGKMFVSLALLFILAFLSPKEVAKMVLVTFIPVYFGNTALQITSILKFMQEEKARKGE